MNALYPVLVTHTRLRPRAHRLRYRAFFLLVDIDVAPKLRLLSRRRSNLFSLRAEDYGTGTRDLGGYVRGVLGQAGLGAAGTRIRLLTMPRCLGYGFNPLSLYLCEDATGNLRAVLYEVNNTFGQRHSYLVPLRQTEGIPLRHSCDKAFFVSPFMDMGLRYRFSLHPPGESLGLHIAVEDQDGVLLRATMAGRGRALTDIALLEMACRLPLLGLKVIAAIHWEAVKLWLKGMRLRTRPAAPAEAVTLATADRTCTS